MKTSPAGIEFIKGFEGLELEAYQDIAGVWTIGYGHTGPDVTPGMKITPADADHLLRCDLVSRERAVSEMVEVRLNQNEFDGLVSFVFNVGAGAFRNSTARRRLNANDRAGAAEALTWWNKAKVNGVLRVVAGLARRREAEKALFLSPIHLAGAEDNGDEGCVAAPGGCGFFCDDIPEPPTADYVRLTRTGEPERGFLRALIAFLLRGRR